MSRAKKRIDEKRPRFAVDPAQQQAMLKRFMAACQAGDLASLVDTFKSDITLYSDGGGKVTAALNPIHGADRVARFVLGVLRKLAPVVSMEYRMNVVNGQPGVAAFAAGALLNVTVFDIDDAAIRNVYVVSNPDKLVRVVKQA